MFSFLPKEECEGGARKIVPGEFVVGSKHKVSYDEFCNGASLIHEPVDDI